mmetsp:Transcript_98325/g.276512  ORF Transcript_98325/g.276512 Transcript_98325/m.276512 type:complete len:85 (+) Transcript_98325:2-256(+)
MAARRHLKLTICTMFSLAPTMRATPARWLGVPTMPPHPQAQPRGKQQLTVRALDQNNQTSSHRSANNRQYNPKWTPLGRLGAPR